MEIEASERELRRITSLHQAIYDDYAAKILTVSEYQFATQKYAADMEQQQLRLEAAKREKAECARNSTPTNKWLTEFLKFMDTKELTVEMAQAMIERVEVSDRDVVTVIFKFRDEYEAVSNYANVRYSEVS